VSTRGPSAATAGRPGPFLDEPRRALRWAGVLLGLAVALCLLMWSTTCRDAIQHVDDAVFHAAENTEWGPAVGFAKVLAFVGGTLVTWCIRVVVLVVLARRRHWLSAAAFALAIVTSEMLIGGLKDAYQRPRPPNGLVTTSGWSFPSGHAIAAAVTALGLVIVLAPPGHARWTWERRAALYASLMAMSRVYLRAHWLSDVVGGALLGAGLAIGWPALLVVLRSRRSTTAAEVPPTREAGEG